MTIMPQLRVRKFLTSMVLLILVLLFTLYFTHKVYLPRTLALTRIRTYLRDFRVV